MKKRFILFQRSGAFYCEDTASGKQTSLRTRSKDEARRLLNARNDARRQSAMNLQIAWVHWQHGDPTLGARTWQDVIKQMVSIKKEETLVQWQLPILFLGWRRPRAWR